MAEQLTDSLGRREGAAPPHAPLSEQQLQGFLRLAQGGTEGHVAQGLSLSVETLSTVRSRVMDRLGLANNSDLT